MVQSRAQVLKTFFSPALFMALIFFSTEASMYGPFLRERPICFYTPSYFLRRPTIYFEEFFFFYRVFVPKVGLPHGGTGDGPPLGGFASTPPCRGSPGVLADPRPVGAKPMWRF